MKLFIGQFKGAKGDKGDKGEKGDKGIPGDTGQRGSRITRGTAITGTNTAGTKFPSSGITDAKVHDYYINSSTGNLYECTVPGAADVAEWVHAGSFKGPKGDTGPAGSISDIDEQKPTYKEAATLENIESGETVKISFGKIKKAISVLISHYTQKAATSILGHVKLSSSTAITTTGEFALDAVEKNAAVAGTLANQIAQQNSNLINKNGSTQCINPCADLNNFYTGNALFSGSTQNMPIGDWCIVTSAGTSGTVSQIAKVIWSDTTYKRFCASGNWTEWSEYKPIPDNIVKFAAFTINSIQMGWNDALNAICLSVNWIDGEGNGRTDTFKSTTAS